MKTVTAIQLQTSMTPVFRLCNKHLLALALHVDCPGFQVLSARHQTLAGNCDSCHKRGPKIIAKIIA